MEKIIQLICPNCRANNRVEARWCIQCGSALDLEEPPQITNDLSEVIDNSQYALENVTVSTETHGKFSLAKVGWFYWAVFGWGIVTAMITRSKDLSFWAFFVFKISILAIIIGLLVPKTLVKWSNNPSRKKVTAVCLSIMICSLIIGECTRKPAEPVTVVQEALRPVPTIDEESFKNSCEQIDYSVLNKKPEDFIGKNIFFTGKVLSGDQDNENVTLIVQTRETDSGIWADVIWANYRKPKGQKYIGWDEHMITIWGTVKGRKTYPALFGRMNEVPEIDAYFVTLQPLESPADILRDILNSSW